MGDGRQLKWDEAGAVHEKVRGISQSCLPHPYAAFVSILARV
jgi:hypothetical protein